MGSGRDTPGTAGCPNGTGPGEAVASPGPVPVSLQSADLVHVDEVDADAAATEGAHDGTQSAGGAAVAADHLAEVVGVDPDLEDAPAAQGARGHLHVVRVVDDALHEVLKS